MSFPEEKGTKGKSKKHEAKIQKLRNLKTNVKKIGPVSVCFNKEFLIGKGCGGTTVHVGLHDDGSEVAVKRILTHTLNEDEMKIGNLFELEKSNNIVNYREFIPGETFCHVILDLCEETLADYIKTLSKEELERRGPEIIREILAGLSALHSGKKKVLHRDLKPLNILVDTAGHMRLADFGLSRMLDESETTVETGAKGTPGWIAAESIEKVTGEKVKFKRKSDIQVTGMICFYILTKGEHPFGDPIDRLSNIAKGDPVYLDKLSDSNAKRFISWLISHDINERPYVEEALDHPYLRLRPDDQQRICAETTDKLKAEKCLDLLPTRGDRAFGDFVVVGCEHLAQLLVTDDQEGPSRKSKTSVERDFQKFKVQDAKNVKKCEQSTPKSCLPEKLATFTARDTEVREIMSFLEEKGSGIVSIVGGPGFGKSTIAVEVSHRLSEQHGIPVFFSYLSTASTVDEVIHRLCHDVGVHPGEDPKSSLIFWLRNLEKNVVLVMDNIDELLECEARAQFNNLICLLRKYSGQQLQIITTSRAVFSIADLSTKMVSVNEMDSDSSMELLRKCSRNEEMDDDYFHEMANLCGHVPLALCIAASRIQDFKDPNELITYLKEQPMEVLNAPESNQYVQKTIKMSFEMLSDEDKKSFVRLSVFDGNFDEDAAKEIIDRNKLGTQDFLKKLIGHSLLQRSDGRYSIHLLIKRFLTDYDQLEEEMRKAQELMVEYFLKKCHSLTSKSYSKDGFNNARESLQKDAHNVEKILKVCQAQETNPNSNIIECLARSDIYKSSSRFFYNFVENVLPQNVIKDFLQYCVELAKNHNQLAIAMNFQCILADQEGHRSGWNKSSEYMNRMEKIKKEFDANEEVFKIDNALLSYYSYSYGRYLFNTAKKAAPPSRPDLLRQADDCLQMSLHLRHDQAQLPLEKADEAISLIQLGRIKKECASIEHHNKNTEKYESEMEKAESHYQKALTLTKDLLGDHELTSTCHKVLGDLFLVWRKNDLALASYRAAKEMYKKLRLDSSESMANLLKNYGSCLFFLAGRFEESVQQLNEARDIADNLAEEDTPTLCRANVYFALAQVLKRWKPDCQEAMPYARKAIEMQEFLDERRLSDMKTIVKKGGKTTLTK